MDLGVTSVVAPSDRFGVLWRPVPRPHVISGPRRHQTLITTKKYQRGLQYPALVFFSSVLFFRSHTGLEIIENGVRQIDTLSFGNEPSEHLEWNDG